jgi:hypothetical protein
MVQPKGLEMASYRCFFFETFKLAAFKECDDKFTAETTAEFGLRWGGFDRAEIWKNHEKLVALTKRGREIQPTL